MSDINQIGILASFSATGFAGSINDKEVADEVTREHSTQSDVYRVSKKLFPASTCGKVNAYTEVRKFIGRTREAHYKVTLPFDDGWQLLPLAGHADHDALMLEAEQLLGDKFLPALRDAYPGLVDAARLAHNGTFDAAMYPPVSEFCERFTIRHEYRPVPSGDAMASHVFSSRMDSIRAGLEATNAAKVQEAVSETWRRLIEPVVDLALRLANPDTRRLKGIVDQVKEVAARIPLLNLTGDQSLAEAGERITAILATVYSDSLNENSSLRGETAANLSALAGQFANLGGRKLAA